MHAVGEQRIVDLPHPHPGALLHAFNCSLCRQAAVDGFIDAAAPPFVIGEHLVRRDDLFMFAAGAEIDLARHAVNLFAHLVKGGIDALALGLGIFGDRVFDAHIGLMENGDTGSSTFDQRQAGQTDGTGFDTRSELGVVNQVGIGDQFGQHHRDGLQCFDLDLFIFAWLHMLNGEHADSAFGPDNRDTCKAVEPLFTRFRHIAEVRVSSRLVEVQRLDIFGNCPDQTFAQAQTGDMHRRLVQAACRKQLQRAHAQQID